MFLGEYKWHFGQLESGSKDHFKDYLVECLEFVWGTLGKNHLLKMRGRKKENYYKISWI